ncbi:MAG: DUF423 domain-containing protein [Pseudoxanthomonas suwonensis]|nr:DUF423 domain-containing protein [Pseudoxanthomonas suwonensis]
MRQRDVLASLGAVLAAAGVALAAWAAHGAPEASRGSLQQAALFALLHGIGIAALAPLAVKRLARIALGLLLAGTLLFSGSVFAGHVWGLPTLLAPWGGSAAILGWLLHAWQRFPR